MKHKPWFSKLTLPKSQSFQHLSLPHQWRVAQITDLHLFADVSKDYFGANSAGYFRRVCEHIAQQPVDLILLTGDITNDHTLASYQVAAEIVTQTCQHIPVCWLPGNHDELAMFERAFTHSPFHTEKHISLGDWQLLLLNSKGETPAGWFDDVHLQELDSCFSSQHFYGVFCHHHLLPIKSYLDKHICENGERLIACLSAQVAKKIPIKFVAHGHIHMQTEQCMEGYTIYGTPASSVQFAPDPTMWRQINSGPCYRLFQLFDDGRYSTSVIQLTPNE